MKFYHWCPIPLEVGSIILPGNFGRIIRTQVGGGNILLLREYIYEEVRKRDYPDKPSRMESCFLCQDLNSALLFAQPNRFDFNPTQLLYEVEILNPDAPIHIAPIEFVGVNPNVNAWNAWTSAAKNYWEWNPSYTLAPMEMVVNSPIKIIAAGISHGQAIQLT